MESRHLPPGTPLLIYAEDDEDTAIFFRAEFQKIAPHWTIMWARDGLAAKCLLVQPPAPCVLVTDLNMPGMNGLELIEWVKAQSQFHSLPVVVRSNSGDPSDRRKCAGMGVSSYLDKPGLLKEVRSQIRYILKLCEASHSFAHT